MWIKDTLSWMKPITAFLEDQVLSGNKDNAYKLRKKVAYFFFQDDVLYNETSPGPSFDARDENRLT